MSAAKKLREQTSPTSLVVFGPLPETTDWYVVWLGPGAGLFIGIRPFSPDGVLARIDHPSADGTYNTTAQARAAANAFAEATA